MNNKVFEKCRRQVKRRRSCGGGIGRNEWALHRSNANCAQICTRINQSSLPPQYSIFRQLTSAILCAIKARVAALDLCTIVAIEEVDNTLLFRYLGIAFIMDSEILFICEQGKSMIIINKRLPRIYILYK